MSQFQRTSGVRDYEYGFWHNRDAVQRITVVLEYGRDGNKWAWVGSQGTDERLASDPVAELPVPDERVGEFESLFQELLAAGQRRLKELNIEVLRKQLADAEQDLANQPPATP